MHQLSIKKIKNISTIKKVANYFLSKEEMSQKKLQKMCFYAYSWYLYFNNDVETGIRVALFKNDFEGWVHGPVSPTLYKAFPFIGNEPLKTRKSYGNIDLNNKELKRHLNLVYNTFKKFTGDELESMTQIEEPWQNSRIGKDIFEPGHEIIKDEIIYKQCAILQNDYKN